MRKIRVYTIDYLINEELTEDDLYYIFETSSLERSFHIYMCQLINPEMDEAECVRLSHKDKWWETIEWDNKLRKIAIKNIAKAYKNIYQIGKNDSLSKAQMYVLLYGPRVKNNRFLEK